MSHFTLLSGKDTSTYTFKCDGCGIRLDRELASLVDTPHRWNAIVCCSDCISLSDKKYDSLILKGDEVVREIVEIGAKGQFTFHELYMHIKRSNL